MTAYSSGIYLGNQGLIELQRISAEDPTSPDIRATLEKPDINDTFNNLSFDPFNTENGGLPFTTGDRLDIGCGGVGEASGVVATVVVDDDYVLPDSLATMEEKAEMAPDGGTSFGQDLTLGPLRVMNGKLQYKGSSGWATAVDTKGSVSTIPVVNGGKYYKAKDKLTLRFGPKNTDVVHLKVRKIVKDESESLYFFDGKPKYKTAYVHVTRSGNISFYETFDKALAGQEKDRLPLSKEASDPGRLRMFFNFANAFRRNLAQVTEFTVNTSRDFVNTTTLGKEHMNMYKSGLISGSGTLRCQWNYQKRLCQQNLDCDEDLEFSQYLATILLRTEVGAAFAARFFLHCTEAEGEKSCWYECPTCLVQKVGVSVAPTEIVFMDIDFVTTGPFSLQTGKPPTYLLTETNTRADAAGYLLQEDKSGDFELELYEDEDG